MLQFMVRRWGNATKQLETSKTTKSSNGPTVLRSHLEEYVKDLIGKYEEVNKSKDLDQEEKSIREKIFLDLKLLIYANSFMLLPYTHLQSVLFRTD